MMRSESHKNILGVVGGMGPLASAEFLKTIYETSLGEREQDSPVVLIYSDPTFPDRTEAFLRGSHDELFKRLSDALEQMSACGISQIVICCITIHYLLPHLPDELRRRVISLVDVIFEQVLESGKKHLLLCTSGTRQMGIFSDHPMWKQAERHIVLLDEQDQRMVHQEIIYEVKKNQDLRKLTPVLERLLTKYEVNSFIVGCTEMHLLAKHFISSGENRKRYECIDPLAVIARNMTKEIYEPSKCA
jgi:aspartate racemase